MIKGILLNVDGAWLNKAALDQIDLMCSILTFQKRIHLISPWINVLCRLMYLPTAQQNIKLELHNHKSV